MASMRYPLSRQPTGVPAEERLAGREYKINIIITKLRVLSRTNTNSRKIALLVDTSAY